MKRACLFFGSLLFPAFLIASGGQGTTQESPGGSGSIQVTVGGSGVTSENKSLVYDAPTNFSIAFTSQTFSSGTWTGILAPSATSYTLQYSTTSNFTTTIYSSDTLNTFATVDGLSHSTLYYARVRANPDGKFSNSASTTTPSAGGTPFTLVQVSAISRVGSGNATPSLTGVGANRLITVQGGHGSTTNLSSLTDQYSHTYSVAKQQEGSSLQSWVYYYVTTAAYAGTLTVTVNAGGSVPITSSMSEWTTPGATPLDISTGTSGSSTTPQTGTSATTAADCSLAVGAFVNNSGVNQAITDPTGWGMLHEEGDGASWLVGGAHFSTGTALNSTTVNPQWGHSNTTWGACVATFRN